MFDVLVGINLLREGLDLPEVSLVLVFDADREGFLRSATSLIQTCGRAARNANGRVVLYADRMTKSIQATISEAERRRVIQVAYNTKHDIVPKTIRKRIVDSLATMLGSVSQPTPGQARLPAEEIEAKISELAKQMLMAASSLDFEQAIRLRDEVRRLEAACLELGP